MQTAHSAAVSALPTVTRDPSAKPSPTSMTPSTAKPSESTLDAFWRRMLGMYGHTWASAYGDAPNGTTAETWASTLAGVSNQQIADGLRACVAEGGEFPPSAPRFRAMCLGIPSLALVRLDIRSGEHSQFTRAVWANLDGYRFRQSSADAADRMLREAYDLTREQVMRGEALPQPSEAITQEKRELVPTPPEKARAILDNLRDLVKRAPPLETVAKPEPVVTREEREAAEAELRQRADRKAAAAGPDQ